MHSHPIAQLTMLFEVSREDLQSWAIEAAIAAVVLFLIVRGVLRGRRESRAEKTGKLAMATVTAVESANYSIGHQPAMRVHLEVRLPDGSRPSITITEAFTPVHQRKVGDQVPVVMDPADPTQFYLADGRVLGRSDEAGDRVRAANSIPERFDQFKPFVGDIVQITPAEGGASSVQVNVVRIGQQPRPVFCTQTLPPGDFAAGDRVYLYLDREDPHREGYLVPLLFVKNKPPKTGNRLDGSVLARDILFDGARAHGTVTRADAESIPDAYRGTEVSQWTVFLRVQPEDGSAAYDGSMTIAVTSRAKAEQISTVGAVLPVRYDPYDRATLSIDTIGLGWGDPAAAENEMQRIAHSVGRL